jgi:hypothetical protein
MSRKHGCGRAVDAEMFAIARMFGHQPEEETVAKGDRAQEVNEALGRLRRAEKRLASMSGSVDGVRLVVSRRGKIVRNGLRSVRACQREINEMRALLAGYGVTA